MLLVFLVDLVGRSMGGDDGLGAPLLFRDRVRDPIQRPHAGRLAFLFLLELVRDGRAQRHRRPTERQPPPWCAANFAGLNYTYLCAEFGTYPLCQMLAGLRAENQAHHWEAPDSEVVRRTKARLKELFCPNPPLGAAKPSIKPSARSARHCRRSPLDQGSAACFDFPAALMRTTVLEATTKSISVPSGAAVVVEYWCKYQVRSHRGHRAHREEG
jgi:hypothetical protein